MKRKRKRRTNKGKPRLNHVLFPKELVGSGRYALRATGDSMMPTIKDGDHLLIEPGRHWQDNSIVIARVGNQPTCKRLRIYSENSVFLVPDNPDYTTIAVGRETKILGRVVARCEYESLIDNSNDADD